MPSKLDRCVRQVYDKLVQDFKGKYQREPDETERADLESRAWAICRKSLEPDN